ncbi:MAG: hypothetical protein LBH52_03330 [Puniceicoccales bacterium]|jgi:hypothetical protein|nr:hypothetical protein [Puniceicoccales bacterium]
MIPRYLLKVTFTIASGLALQTHAASTQDVKKTLESMPVVTPFDAFNIDEYFLDNTSTQRPPSSNNNNRSNSNDLKKTSPDAIWEVNYNSFDEIDPW